MFHDLNSCQINKRRDAFLDARRPYKTAALSGVRGAGKSKSADFLKYQLSDVVITTVQHGDSESSTPMEQFSLNYSKIEVSYTPQLASGKIGAPIRAGFDVKANKKI